MKTSELNFIALSKEELRSMRACASRAKRHGEPLDRALAQRLREWLWRRLSEEVDVKEVDAIYSLLLAARRVSERSRESERTPAAIADREIALRNLYGDFPPVRPYDMPPPDASELTNSTDN